MNREQLKAEFRNPGAAYRGKPFWSWNGELDKDELKRQIHVLKEMGFGGYFMHSRAGLITEYLGDEWFDLINEVADEGERLGMESWLYDEDRWPSGSAGGKVTIDPQYSMKSLVLYETPMDEYSKNEDDFAVYLAKVDDVVIDGYKKLEDGVLPEDADSSYKVLVFRIVPDAPGSVYNGTTYIDTMSLKATKRFMELTHEEYKKRCGDRLGRSIKGIFTDEPHRGKLLSDLHSEGNVRVCSLCYTDDIFEEFEKRYGYSALDILPEIYYMKRGYELQKVKHDYIDLANALFIERFAKPINEWCEENGIDFTGHVLHEDSLMFQTVPNGSLMRFYEYMGVPGIDLLCENNFVFWAAKQIKSSARQLGKEWLLSELYGCTGWNFNFDGHKSMGDWQALYGINVRCPHLSWYTMEGESKRDYPASIFHQASYYKDYNFVESYFARFGLMMKQGKTACDVLVLNPIESVWGMMKIGWAQWIQGVTECTNKLERAYRELFAMLTDNQIDFDYGDEEMMSRLASVEKRAEGAVLKVGRAEYHKVVIGGAYTVRKSTYKLLKEFAKEGGKIIFTGDLPTYIDCEKTDLIAKLADSACVVPFETEALGAAVKEGLKFVFECRNSDGTPVKNILSQVYIDDGDVIITAINTDRSSGRQNVTLHFESACPCTSKVKFCEKWDFRTGDRFRHDASVKVEGGKTVVDIPCDFDATGEVCFVMTDVEDKNLLAEYSGNVEKTYKIIGEFSPVLDEKNVGVLDTCRFSFNGSAFSEPFEALFADREIRKINGLEFRGGGMLQPWYSKINDKKVYGTLDLEYEFNVETVPEGKLFLCGERPELNNYCINGIPLKYDEKDGFWIDIVYKRMEIPAGAIKLGRNVVTVHTDFMRTTNVEAVFITGDFGVRVDGRYWTMCGFPKTVGLGNLAEYDLPFYTGCVSYRLDLSKYYEKGKRILIKTPSYYGSLVKVTRAGDINGADKKVLGFAPYEADVTYWVQSGDEVDVTFVAARKNVFGPLHQVPAVWGAVGPDNFTTGGEHWDDSFVLADSHIGEIIVEIVGE